MHYGVAVFPAPSPIILTWLEPWYMYVCCVIPIKLSEPASSVPYPAHSADDVTETSQKTAGVLQFRERLQAAALYPYLAALRFERGVHS